MFRKVTKSLLVFISTLACALNMMSPVSGLEAGDIVMQVRPGGQDIELIPGERYTGSIKVANIGRLAFNLTASVSPYQALNENYDPDFVTENNFTKLYNWISFVQTTYHLEPGETVELEFEIDVPDDAPSGGQYAAILVKTEDGKEASATMQVASQLASFLYAHVAGEDHEAGSVTNQTLPSFLLGSPFTSSVTVQNDGNVDFRFEHTLTIHDYFTNREVFNPDSVDENNQALGIANPIVLPGTSRTNTLTWEGAPQLGLFRAISRVTYLGEENVKEQVVFICPIWLAVAVVFFVVLMVLWIILRIRKHQQNRPQVV